MSRVVHAERDERMKRSMVLFAVAVLLLTGAALGASASKNYLVVAKGEGPGSADLDAVVSSAGGTIAGRIPEIGVVLASSTNPAFMKQVLKDSRIQQVAEDIEVPWLPPGELAVEPLESDLQATGLNSEPYWAYQWNIG